MIREMITQFANLAAGIGSPALLENFVLRNGKEYKAVPVVGKLGTPKFCFDNCYNAALAGRGTYAEGLAYRPGLPIVVHHAWLVVDGGAMDITWREPTAASFGSLLDCEYLGLEFDNDKLRRHAVETGYGGSIISNEMYNLDLMREIDPELVQRVLTQRR